MKCKDDLKQSSDAMGKSNANVGDVERQVNLEKAAEVNKMEGIEENKIEKGAEEIKKENLVEERTKKEEEDEKNKLINQRRSQS